MSPELSRHPAALYCYAISDKRYALFNLTTDGGVVLRKGSAHGLGHLLAPYSDETPSPVAPHHAARLPSLACDAGSTTSGCA